LALTPFPIERFGGLNLADDPMEVGYTGATDGFNFWPVAGGIQTIPQPGSYATATSTVRRLASHGINLLASESDGTNATLEAFSGSLSLATSTYASSSTVAHGFATVGTSSASRTYAVRLGDTTRRWDGSSWATASGVPAGKCAAPADGGTRLAVGYAGSNAHRVAFSNVGDPETFGADDYVDIAPGDGESVCALVWWNNLLFAFKNTKFAVFYGASTDADGGAIFNYRMVDTGVGVGFDGIPYTGGACAAREGVYFVGKDGVYLTQGAAPVLVSNAIKPLWQSQLRVNYANVSQIALTLGGQFDISSVQDTIYLSASTLDTLNRVLLAYREGQWTYLTVLANGSSSDQCNVTNVLGVPVYSLAGSTTIRSLDPTVLATGLSWAYTSGRYSLADNPGRVAVTPETSLYGHGTVTLRLDSDLYTDQSGSVTLGTDPAVAEGWPSGVDQEGTWFQHTLTGSDAARVSRMVHHVSSVKPAGVR
jgi:hypothetical protein